MFGFLKKHPQNKELDKIVQSIEVNAANNYKDAAQNSLLKFEEQLTQLEEAGRLSEKQKIYYHEKLSAFKQQMKNFTHKDQKPTWI